MQLSNWRVVVTLILLVLAVMAFWNTFKLWTLSPEDKAAMLEKDPGSLTTLEQKAIRLGLDLQGGIHVVLRVKLEELNEAEKEDAV